MIKSVFNLHFAITTVVGILMSSSRASALSLREALTGTGSNDKTKVPTVADGILSVTPDTPEVVEWRSRSALDVAETSSLYLDDDCDGGAQRRDA